MFSKLFGKNKTEPDNHDIVTRFLSMITNDVKLIFPVYFSDIKSESDADSRDFLPLIYIWNEDREIGSFTVSINSNIVGYLLEPLIPRESPRFKDIRDQVMQALSVSAKNNVLEICEKTGKFPSEIFSICLAQ